MGFHSTELVRLLASGHSILVRAGFSLFNAEVLDASQRRRVGGGHSQLVGKAIERAVRYTLSGGGGGLSYMEPEPQPGDLENYLREHGCNLMIMGDPQGMQLWFVQPGTHDEPDPRFNPITGRTLDEVLAQYGTALIIRSSSCLPGSSG